MLGWTGRPLAKGEPDHRRHPGVVRRIEGGDPRFWALVTVLADAVQEAGTLRWRKARGILRDADQRWLAGEHPAWLDPPAGTGRPQNN